MTTQKRAAMRKTLLTVGTAGSPHAQNAATDGTLAQIRTILQEGWGQKTGNISKNSLWTDHAQNKSFFPTNHATFRRRFVGGGHNSSVLSKPNQQHLRKRNTSVEHPYGTVKRWRGANYLLTKGKVKVADETGLSFLAYNFRRAVNLQGTDKLLQIIGAG